MTMNVIADQDELRALAEATAAACGVDLDAHRGDQVAASPLNGRTLSSLAWVDADEVDAVVARAHEAFVLWRTIPAPARGAHPGRRSHSWSCPSPSGHTMFSSGRTSAWVNRLMSSALTSTTGCTPLYRSRMTSPTAGPMRKPWPENPVA